MRACIHQLYLYTARTKTLPSPASVASLWKQNILCAGSQRRRSLLTKAYDRGPSEPPLLEQTIPQHFDGIVSKNGDRPAVISYHQNETVTYRQLQERSNAIAHGLKSMGVKKGDRVAVSMGNCMEFAIITYSLFRLGAILVPLNPGFTTNQVIAALNHLSASLLVTGVETNLPYKPPIPNRPLFEKLIDDPAASTLQSSTVPSLAQLVVANNSSRANDQTLERFKSIVPFSDLISTSTSPPAAEPQDNHDTINIQFTSGTTAMPKAAQLTHRNVLNNGHQIGSFLSLGPEDVICCPPPLFHCFGCVLGYMATATHGSAILFPAPAFDPKLTLEAAAAHRATGLYGVPTMFAAELALLSENKDGGQVRVGGDGDAANGPFARLRTGIAAGSSVPAELMRKLHRQLNLRDLAICYGMTETSPVSCMTTASDPLDKRTDTVGRVMPHVRVKVVDPATGETLAVGERGELMVAGYVVMKGYFGDEERTREAFSVEVDEEENAGLGKGEAVTWMRTGDEASIDAEGYVSITGRIKDLIIRGGENVHPLEIEDCLLAMDGVVDVSVVGVKDERYGEVVAAFVIRSGGERGEKGCLIEADHVRDWVRERLSGHLVPKFVFFTDAFPKTASGKVQKFALRDEAERLKKENESLV